MSNLTEIADKLADQIMAMGDGEKFVLLSETSGRGLPLIAWRLKDTKGPYDGELARFRRVTEAEVD